MKTKYLIKLQIIILFSILFFQTNCKKQNSNEDPNLNINNPEIYDLNSRFYVTVNQLKVRSEPNLKSQSIGVLNKGDSFKILEEGGENTTIENLTAKWGKVSVKKLNGWIFLGFVSSTAPELVTKEEIEKLILEDEKNTKECKKKDDEEREKNPNYQSCSGCGSCSYITTKSVNDKRGCTEYKIDEVLKMKIEKKDTRSISALFEEYGDSYCQPFADKAEQEKGNCGQCGCEDKNIYQRFNK